MRDILDKLLLIESIGLANRKKGDLFQNLEDSTQTLTFQGIEFFPEGGGTLTPDELLAHVTELNNKKQVVWTNSQTPSSAGLGVATFTDDAGQEHLFARFFRDIKGFSRENNWPNAGIPGYRYASKAANKVVAGMTPQDVLGGAEVNDLTPESLVEAIEAKLGVDYPLAELARAISAGNSLPITVTAPTDIGFEAFRDYFCELLHPIALVRGSVTGDVVGFEEQFLPDSGFHECKITFSNSKTEGLSDSLLIAPSGTVVKVSSKGGPSGAAASVKNLTKAIDEVQQSNSKITKTRGFREVVAILDLISSTTAKKAPLLVGKHLGVIDDSDVQAVNRIEQLERAGELTYKSVYNSSWLTPTLKKLFAKNQARDPDTSSAYFHAVAVIAKTVAEHINTRTEFPQVAAQILNNAAMIQIHTQARNNKTTWTLEKLEARYPGDSTSAVFIDSSKNYYSTKVHGSFTFKVKRGDKKAKPEPMSINSDPVEAPAAKLADPTTAAHSDITANRSVSKPNAAPAALGRSTRSGGY